jgi:hypothetical protein
MYILGFEDIGEVNSDVFSGCSPVFVNQTFYRRGLFAEDMTINLQNEENRYRADAAIEALVAVEDRLSVSLYIGGVLLACIVGWSLIRK